MKILISPISREEARSVCEGGADIVDVKNIREGSLGANFPWIIQDICDAVKDYPIATSATLGDLANKPGTAALAAYGLASLGINYVKAGLFGVRTRQEAAILMGAVVRACRQVNPRVQVVAAGYADYRQFDGLPTDVLVQAASDAGADLVMVDTAIKDGRTLFDHLSPGELEDFVCAARELGMQAALAGSLRFEHLDMLQRLRPAFIGVRGCVCQGKDRSTTIDPVLVRNFVCAARGLVGAG